MLSLNTVTEIKTGITSINWGKNISEGLVVPTFFSDNLWKCENT